MTGVLSASINDSHPGTKSVQMILSFCTAKEPVNRMKG
jgi:hypothetical protein